MNRPSTTMNHSTISALELDSLRRMMRNGRILQLVKLQEWDALRKHIWTPEGQQEAVDLSSNDVGTGWNVLHLLSACKDIPCDIVTSFIRIRPQLVAARDRFGRTPLHVAARFSAGLDVISCLIDAHPGAAAAKDDDGKTPLILACEKLDNNGNGGSSFWNDGDQYRALRARAAIKALADASPESVGVADDLGNTAFYYAVMGGAPTEVVRLVRVAASTSAPLCSRLLEKIEWRRAVVAGGMDELPRNEADNRKRLIRGV